jgi:hypothetical protein
MAGPRSEVNTDSHLSAAGEMTDNDPNRRIR